MPGIKGILIPPQGDVVQVTPIDGRELMSLVSFAEVLRFVDPWTHIPFDGHPRPAEPYLDRTVMLVDEEGALKGLPLNPRASYLYHRRPIVGPAVLVGMHFTHEEGWDFYDIPPEFESAEFWIRLFQSRMGVDPEHP